VTKTVLALIELKINVPSYSKKTFRDILQSQSLSSLILDKNKMQSETADFALGAAIWPTGRNMRVVFDYGPLDPLCKNVTSST